METRSKTKTKIASVKDNINLANEILDIVNQ